MLTSLYSGISGIRAHRTMLDVVGNNIANINTPGFKGSRVRFADIMSQQLGTSAGGTPTEIGLGVRAGAIDRDYSQGALLQTGNTYDLALGSEGFFVLNDGTSDYYTRAGAFSTDVDGNLIDTVSGYNVRGYAIDGETVATDLSNIQIPIGGKSSEAADAGSFKSVSIEPDGKFYALYTDGVSKAFAQVERVTFDNPNGLEHKGDNLFSSNSQITGDATSIATDAGRGSVVMSGALESSNVDITKELTNLIIAQRGFSANSRTIMTSSQVLQEIMQIV